MKTTIVFASLIFLSISAFANESIKYSETIKLFPSDKISGDVCRFRFDGKELISKVRYTGYKAGGIAMSAPRVAKATFNGVEILAFREDTMGSVRIWASSLNVRVLEKGEEKFSVSTILDGMDVTSYIAPMNSKKQAAEECALKEKSQKGNLCLFGKSAIGVHFSYSSKPLYVECYTPGA